MSIFADTSGLYAVFDKNDRYHADAAQKWRALLATDEAMVTTNYVVGETIALLQRRIGFEASREFVENVLPVLEVEFVNPQLQNRNLNRYVEQSRRNLSFVDGVSFELMHARSIAKAFAFDRHFEEEGFQLLSE